MVSPVCVSGLYGPTCVRPEPGGRGARIYSVLATCKKDGVNPSEWLRAVLSGIRAYPGDQLDELLPANWQPANDVQASQESCCFSPYRAFGSPLFLQRPFAMVPGK
jgi:hypothetical protein